MTTTPFVKPTIPVAPARLIRRLLAFAWAYRKRCLTVIGYQVGMLLLALVGLGLAGLGLDELRAAMSTSAPLPRWPMSWLPAPSVSPLTLVTGISVLLLLTAVARAAVSYRYNIAVGHLVQMEIVPSMRSAVYDKLQRMSFRFFDATASGSIINRVTGDVQAVRAFVDQVLIQSVILALALVVFLFYMLGKNVGLTVACLATTPLMWTATTLFSRWVHPSYARTRELADRLTTTFSETIQGIRVIKGFAREPERKALYETHNKAVRDQQRRIFNQVSVFSPAVDLLGQMNVVVLLLFGGRLVAQGQLTLGDLVVFTGLLQQFGAQVSNLAAIVNTLQQSLISAKRVFEILDAPAEVESPQVPLRPAVSTGAVRFEDVHFGYHPGETALAGIDIDVQPGQRIVLFGETGCGKSTLLALIPRFYDPSLGRVLVDGLDVRSFDLHALRQQIGVVFQESFLFSATIAENIAFGQPTASAAQIEEAARLASAHDFIAALPEGYDTFVDEGGTNLSGGQRQRLAIARATLMNPRILLLDDPTAAVDPQTEHEVLAALDRVAHARTTFIATHRMGACVKADLILVLDNGRVVERGTHAGLLKARGHYFAVAELQRRGDRALPGTAVQERDP